MTGKGAETVTKYWGLELGHVAGVRDNCHD
jgi:hypothetical protein